MKIPEYGFTYDTPMVPLSVEFTYVNWRGDQHVYVIAPEAFAIGPYAADGLSEDGSLTVVLHGDVISRDGDLRLDMGNVRRRTFLAEKIRDLKVVPS